MTSILPTGTAFLLYRIKKLNLFMFRNNEKKIIIFFGKCFLFFIDAETIKNRYSYTYTTYIYYCRYAFEIAVLKLILFQISILHHQLLYIIMLKIIIFII